MNPLPLGAILDPSRPLPLGALFSLFVNILVLVSPPRLAFQYAVHLLVLLLREASQGLQCDFTPHHPLHPGATCYPTGSSDLVDQELGPDL